LSDTRRKLANGLLFNLSWLAIVGTESSLPAPPVVAVHLLVHYIWFSRPLAEWLLIAGVALFGALLDQALFALDLFRLEGRPAPAPLWLSCLWPVLATTLIHAFGFLQRHLLLAAALGALGGAGSYYTGTAMSSVDFRDPLAGTLLIGVLWTALLPLLALAARAASREMDRGRRRSPAAGPSLR